MAIIESSLTRSTYTSGFSIYTAAELGYWTEPGFNYGHACGMHPEFTTAQNTTVRSKVLLQATYTLGWGGIANILTVDTTFNHDSYHSRADMEPATFYTSLDFANAEYINVATGVTTPATSRLEQNSPIIMYNGDDSIAIGISSKDVGMRYTWSVGIDSVHESCYFHAGAVQANSSSKKQCQFIIGTRAEVEQKMVTLAGLK